MNTLFLATLLSLSTAATPPPVVGRVPAEKDALKAVVKGNTAFALDLHQQLCKQPGNLCYSPWSISTVLSMVSAGAKGRTLEQMTKTLHLPDARLTHAGAAALLQQMKPQRRSGLLNLFRRTEKDYELNIANAMFAGTGIPWRWKFLALNRRYYDSALFKVDFRRQPETARRKINSWVEGQTHRRIRNLLSQGSISQDTSIVLVNAVYFKGRWAKPFKKNRTEPMDFWRKPNDKVKTPMMFQSDSFLYGENSEVQILGMPYKGNDFMMVFILPRQRHGLVALEKDLSGHHFQTWIAQLKSHPKVDVYLPRFTMTFEFDLSHTLAEMGMPDLFTKNADLSGMTVNYPLKISKVIHKVFLELQEEGTEAAAATAAIARPLSAPPTRLPPPRPVFRADQPFLFSIVDRRSGSLLFVGRVSDPAR